MEEINVRQVVSQDAIGVTKGVVRGYGRKILGERHTLIAKGRDELVGVFDEEHAAYS